MTFRKWMTAAALAFATALPATAAEKKAEFTFGAYKTASPEAAKAQAAAWLKSVNKLDQKALDAVWAKEDLTVLDKVAEALALGSAEAKKILDESLAADRSAPKAVPAVLKDTKQDPFFRANLALAFARNLTGARVYEEALEALETIRPGQVVEPATYFFHKAVAAHALIKRSLAQKAVAQLLDNVPDAPDRYKMLATIMFVDMQGWKKDGRDLASIVRLMDNSERRLDLGRGGKITQDIQKRIVFRLDELIKEKEQPPGGPGSGAGRPTPGDGGGPNAKEHMPDSKIATNGGPGNVLEQKLKHYQQNWVKMPPHERARAIQELTKDLPPRYKVVIEDYFKSLNRANPQP